MDRDGHAPVTGLLSSFVNVSCFTSLLNTDAVRTHARRTAAIAIWVSAAYAAMSLADMVEGNLQVYRGS